MEELAQADQQGVDGHRSSGNWYLKLSEFMIRENLRYQNRYVEIDLATLKIQTAIPMKEVSARHWETKTGPSESDEIANSCKE